MQRDRLIRECGPLTRLEQERVESWPEFRAALEDVPGARERLRARLREYQDPQPTGIRHRVTITRPRATGADQRRVTVDARRAAPLAAESVRKSLEPGLWWFWLRSAAEIKPLRNGVDTQGSWEDFRLGPKPRERVRLRNEPLALEMPSLAPGPRATGSRAAHLIRAARELAGRALWSEAEAARYIANGEVPRLAPVTVRILRGTSNSGDEIARAVTILVRDGVSTRAVARAYRNAAGRTGGAPRQPRTLEVVEFVARAIDRCGGRPRGFWPATWQDWNRAHRGHERFPTWRRLWNAYDRGTKRSRKRG